MAATLPELLSQRCAATPEAAAYVAIDARGRWAPTSWSQLASCADSVAAALLAGGVGKGQRVAIMAATSVAWEFAQHGALRLGAVVAGIDPAYPAEQLEQVLRPLAPAALCVDDRQSLARLPEDLRSQTGLVLLFNGEAEGANELSLGAILAGGRGEAPLPPGPAPDDAALMVYSSGTTGAPKAIVYTHRQVLLAIAAILGQFDGIDERTRLVCWLPLANLFQRQINFCAIAAGACSHLLRDPRTLMDHLGAIAPDLLIGVPRVFERIQRGLMQRLDSLPRPLPRLAAWAIASGRERALARCEARTPRWAARLFAPLAELLLFRRLRAAFGGRLRFALSGSAPMPRWLLLWYEAIGLPLLEAYGTSENIVPNAINRLDQRKLGSVGRPLPPTELRLDEDGEILLRGPGLCAGYWQAPEESAGRFTDAGYWRSGDLGRFDEQGFLFLLGRKSEIIKTPDGKWLAPQRVEEQLRRAASVEQAAVLSLASGGLAAILSLAAPAPEDPGYARLRAELQPLLGDLPANHRPRAMIVSREPFSVAAGELTTNLKLRRATLAERHAAPLQRLERELAQRRRAGDAALLIVDA